MSYDQNALTRLLFGVPLDLHRFETKTKVVEGKYILSTGKASLANPGILPHDFTTLTKAFQELYCELHANDPRWVASRLTQLIELTTHDHVTRQVELLLKHKDSRNFSIPLYVTNQELRVATAGQDSRALYFICKVTDNRGDLHKAASEVLDKMVLDQSTVSIHPLISELVISVPIPNTQDGEMRQINFVPIDRMAREIFASFGQKVDLLKRLEQNPHHAASLEAPDPLSVGSGRVTFSILMEGHDQKSTTLEGWRSQAVIIGIDSPHVTFALKPEASHRRFWLRLSMNNNDSCLGPQQQKMVAAGMLFHALFKATVANSEL